MTVVADATPLIYLAAIRKFHLLQTLYGRIVIPEAVHDEVVTQGGPRPGAVETAASAWVERRRVVDSNKVSALRSRLGDGESEVIVLAEEIGADLVIIDETAARRELAARGIAYTGTVGSLIQARFRGLIPALKPELDQLRASGFYLTEPVYRACLAAAGE
jgi:predicted nucleic acid-binding protein